MKPTPGTNPAEEAHDRPNRLVRLPVVIAQVGLGRTAILERVEAGTFPKPLKIGRASLWSERHVQAWIADRVAEHGEHAQ